MADASARSNVIAPLKELGLVDEAGKPTKLAERWRHDDDYAAVCHEIRASVYPNDLVEAFPDPDTTRRDAIKSWFMKVGRVGESAARMYTDTYLLLSEADPTKNEIKAAAAATSVASSGRPKKNVPVTARRAPRAPDIQPPAPPPASDTSIAHRRQPALHIDVQVHIAPDTPSEQIDRIFESMAKHLGGFIK